MKGSTKKRDCMILLFTCFWVFIIPFLVYLVGVIWFKIPPKSERFISTLILLGTMFAIVIYTWKTWQLKDLTSKQINYNIRPIIFSEVSSNSIKVCNIGKGVALGIQAKAILGLTKEQLKEFKCEEAIVTEKIGVLKNDSEPQQMPFNCGANGSKSIHVIQGIKNILITYRDIDGVNYETHMRKKKNGTFEITDIC